MSRSMMSFSMSFPLSDYPTDVMSPIGQKALILQPRYIYQYNAKGGFFIMGQTGLDFRMIPDAQFGIPVVLKAGYAGQYIYLDVWSDWMSTLNSGIDDGLNAGNGSTWWKMGLSAFVPISDHWGVVLASGKYFSGRNIGLAWHLKGAIVYRIPSK